MTVTLPGPYRVIESWVASYPDPIELAAGEPLELTGRSDIWDGHRWLWAKNQAGREGWIPDSLIADHAPVAREAYTARELTCETGETLTVEKRQHGWAFCTNARGETGWVPLRNLAT